MCSYSVKYKCNYFCNKIVSSLLKILRECFRWVYWIKVNVYKYFNDVIKKLKEVRLK